MGVTKKVVLVPTKYKRKPVKPQYVLAVQFTGKNGKDIAEWANSLEKEAGYHAQSRGSWILFTRLSYKVKVFKGDWLVYSMNGVHVWSNEDFIEHFMTTK